MASFRPLMRSRSLRFCSAAGFLALSIFVVPVLCAQNENNSAALKGVVRDSHGQVIRNLTVYLDKKAGVDVHRPTIDHPHLPSGTDSVPLSTSTDAQGAYSFSSLPEGSYSLRAVFAGTGHADFGPFTLRPKELKIVDLTLTPATSSASAPAFYDEPQFTVAGITQMGNAGGHGSDTVQRTSDALAKATVSLSNSSGSAPQQAEGTAALERSRAETRARLAHEDTAELHHSLADLEERLSNPLAAVREHQRAAEMEPSEPYLFDWGAELLAHRAPGPAAEVFTKGHRLFPKSSRMLVGLGVALYTRGSYAEALQRLFEASDLNPSDPAPYLFLGKVQGVETAEMSGFVDKFARFVSLQPDNALANYYYAVSLWKQSKSGEGKDNPEQLEELLQKAVRLDPSLSAAYLQMGIIFAENGDLQRAIASYQKAIATDPNSAEGHYRLAQAYRRSGEKEKAEREFQLYGELSKRTADQAERERREIQQFVITLRDKEMPQQSR